MQVFCNKEKETYICIHLTTSKKKIRSMASAITDEFERQNSHIELIASENWVSPAVMSAMEHPHQ